jgi:hypothetical protein
MRHTTYCKSIFLFIMAAFFSVHSSGQIVWQKTIGSGNDTAEIANDVFVNRDGSFIVAGQTDIGTVMKFDTAGSIVWKTYLPNSSTLSTVIAFDDTSYLCLGSGISVDTVTGNHWGGFDVLLAKINMNGSVIWQKYYGGSKQDKGVDIVKTTDGGFAVLSNTHSTNGQLAGADSLPPAERNAWIFKINPAGHLIWQKSLDYLDSNFNDDAAAILIANDQQLMVQTFPGTYLVNQTSGAVSYFNYSDNGMPGYIYPSPISVCKTDDGNAYLFCYHGLIGFDFGVKKIALDGTLLSIDTITSPVLPPRVAQHGIIALPGGEYFCAGYIEIINWPGEAPEYINGNIYNSYTRQLSNFGNDYDDYFASVKLLPGGEGVLAVGYTNGYSSDVGPGPFTSDIWMVKINFGTAIREPSVWTGAASVAWENPANWNTNKVPDINTTVTIPAGAPNFPEISSNANCYTISINPAATVLVKTGFKLYVAGKNN